MNKKQSKRQRDIKTKLMAAVCMLLVSSIMMVSTTYAWFTLSTAPEVTGITTAVGANGNLEMALVPLSGDTTEIGAKQGDSMMVQNAKLANVTWGNLVDLKSGYGLDQIVLYPSELNILEAKDEDSADRINVGAGILKTPTYGADGRIAQLKANTFAGVYTDQGGFYQTVSGGTETIDTPMGVRGIGTISSMSPRELAYRQAMSAGSTAATQAAGAASAAMSNNGAGVAQIALDHATGGGEETYDDTDVQWLINIVDALLGGTGKTGAVSYMETALKQYILASNIAPVTADATFQTIVDAVNAEGVTVYDLANGTVTGVTVNDTIKGYVTTLKGISDKLTDSKTTLTNLKESKDEFTWSEISAPMTTLINIDEVIFDGPDGFLDENNKDGNPDELTMAEAMTDQMSFAVYILQKGMVMKMRSGSGIFVELADFCGDFTSSFIMTNVKVNYESLNTTVDELQVTMIADTDKDPVYLTGARTAAGEFVGAGGSTGDSPISDFYGYIIDLAFRTNAADSWLQLQQKGVDRIYEQGTNTNTQGGGACMTFTTADSSVFSVASMKNLMSAIKIVFFDPSSEDANEIIGYAKLDTVNIAKEDATSVSMYLVMCDEDGNALEDDAAIQIMQLNQNQIHQLSVLVYLDGNQVGNDDVSTAAMSMTGSMNLQFSSSANLVAMEYADLKSGDGGALNGGSSTESTTPTAINLTNASIEANGTGVSIATAKYAEENVVIALMNYTPDNVDSVTIKVGDAEAVKVEPQEVQGVYVITYAAADVVADTPVVVTITAAAAAG